VDQYVALDSIYTFGLYRAHLAYIAEVSEKNVRLPIYKKLDVDGKIVIQPVYELRIPKWPQLPNLVEWEQRISWASAVQAIRGIMFDKDYALKKLDEYQAARNEALEEVLTIADESNPFDGWEKIFQTIYWYHRMLETLKRGTKYSSPNYKGQRAWKMWEFYPVDEDLVMKSLTFDKPADTEEDEERRKLWLDWLLQASPDWPRAQLKRNAPEGVDTGDMPYIDIFNFVRDQSVWDTDDTLIVDYLTRTKLDWLEYYFTHRDPLPDEMIITKGKWIPYHLFVVCKIAIPSEEDFRSVSGITTKKHGQRVRQLNGDTNPNFSYMKLALREGLMSAGKEAIRYYLERDPDEAPNFMHFRRFVDADAQVSRITEYMAHASRDGFIHSVIVNTARTSRGRSRGPNLQNLPMRGEEKGFRGYLIAPGNRRAVEADISNAENVHGAVVSRDDAFAYAVMSLDFHSLMRDQYWPDLMVQFKARAEAGDHQAIKLLKDYRDLGKRVTFGDFYGAGVKKISRELGCSLEEAALIKKRKEQAFPKVTKKRADIEETCKQRVRQGFYPAYISLWEGSRVIVDSHLNSFDVNTYMAWNYTLQGGVGRIVARARAELVEMEIDMPRMEDGLPECFIGMDVHDALICCVSNTENVYVPYVTTVVQRLCQQVPEKALQRTIPYIRYVAEVGPENAEKWGWRDGIEYPFSLDYFINQWGYWKLPDDELEKPPRDREAPSWKGPMHEGWTVDKECALLRHDKEVTQQKDIARENGSGGVVRVDEVGAEWALMQQILTYFPGMIDRLDDNRKDVEWMLRHKQVTYIDKYGDEKQTEPLNFTNFMAASKGLFDLGYDMPTYQDNLANLQTLLHLRLMVHDWLEMVETWVKQYGDTYLPKAGSQEVRANLGSGSKERRIR